MSLFSGLLAICSLSAIVTAKPTAQTSQSQIAWNVGQRVQVAGGVIEGQPSKWQPDVSEYLGIPFAQPPVGPLRFAAPKPIQINGTIKANKFGFSCPSNLAPSANKTIGYDSWAQTMLGHLAQIGDEFGKL
jgi:hypothetical protein